MFNPDDFLNQHFPVADLKAHDRWQAIVELFDLLVAEGKITARQRPEIAAAVKRRETTMSTGIGSGIGIPHTLSNLIKAPIAAFGRSKTGIDFDAPDKKLVHKVCLFIVPASLFSQHTQILSQIVKRLHRKDF